MENQELYDRIESIGNEYDVPVEVEESYGDLILKSFASTPMIQDLQMEFISVYFTGVNVPKELMGMSISGLKY
jgi:hypothetical protein